MSNLVGKTLGKYEIVAQLGSGGMAEVFRAYQPGLEREVAIKMLHSHLLTEPGFVSRFEREAATLARLRHPNIVRLYDFETEGTLAYMVMELIDGVTLQDRLRQMTADGQVFSAGDTAQVGGALCGAIDYAHAQGMIHRDLKPSNIMFTREGQVMLTDFGIAYVLGAARQTASGVVVGTPTYMSPEQCRGEQGDPRSDIYSLGVIFYEMSTGQPPFPDRDIYALIHKHLNEPPPSLHEANPALPVAFERVVLKALSKDPQLRFQTAMELAAALAEAAGVRPPSVETPARKAARERFTEAGTLVVAPALSLMPAPSATPLASRAATPSPQYLAPFQVPPEAARFIGRESLLDDFRRRLVQPDGPRVFCFTGMGGAGKTALAIHLAHELRAEFAGGVLWANAATSEPLAIVDSWARAYGCDFSSIPDLQSRATALRGVLASRRVLIVLDDVRSPEPVRLLLPGGRECVTVITTRDLELAAALNAQVWPVGALTETESLRLLTSILGEARLQGDREAAAEIGQLLGYLPLAVEIAAQRLSSRHRWQLSDLAKRLRDEKHRLDELKLSDREVRASFAVSWNALAEPLRQAFACLAVFEARPFSVGAAAAVAQLEPEAAEDALYALSALSLVFETDDGRYWQHPLLADFACERLSESTAAYRRMAAYYLEYAIRHRSDYARLERMGAHLAAGLRVAYQQALWPMVLAYAEVMREAWFTRGHFAELRQTYAWACEAAEALDDQGAARTCRLELGRACYELTDYAEAKRHLLDSLTLAQALKDTAGQAGAQIALARLALEQDQYDEAQRLLTDSRLFYTQAGDELGQAETDFLEAGVRYRRNDFALVESLAQRALAVQIQAANENAQFETLTLLARNALEQKATASAVTYAQQALALTEKLKNQAKRARVCEILATVYLQQDNFPEARRCAEEGLTLSKNVGDRSTQALLLYQLGRVHERQDQLMAAVEAYSQGLQLVRELKADLLRAFTLIRLGDVYQRLAQPGQALAQWKEALELGELLQNPMTVSEAHRRLAAIPATSIN